MGMEKWLDIFAVFAISSCCGGAEWGRVDLILHSSSKREMMTHYVTKQH